MAIFCWLQHLVEVFGEPLQAVKVQLVTDSEASIVIQKSVQELRGLKDVLRPDVDVALAISSKQKILPWIKLKMVKVKSHILIEEAQNQLHWEVNDIADKLATTARQKVENQEEEAALPILLEGSIVGCKVEGILCGNGMKKKVREQIGTADLINYLCYKYLWTKEIF